MATKKLNLSCISKGRGDDCSTGRAVAPYTGGPRFKSHQQTYLIVFLAIVYVIEKRNYKKNMGITIFESCAGLFGDTK